MSRNISRAAGDLKKRMLLSLATPETITQNGGLGPQSLKQKLNHQIPLELQYFKGWSCI